MKQLIQARAAIVATLIALPLLAACTGEESSPSADADETAVAVTDESTAPVTLDAELAADSEFCELAVDTIPVADEITAKTEGMQALLTAALTSGDVAAINAWGAELAELDNQMIEFYEIGRPYVEDDPIITDWDTMESFIRDYSLALANTAATSTDTTSFTLALAEIATGEGVSDLLMTAPASAEAINVYINDRCGVVG